MENNFFQLLLNGLTVHQFLFSFFLILFGILLYTLIRVVNRKDQNIPWSNKIWWQNKHNVLQIVISILFIYPQIIFANVYEDWVMTLLPTSFKTAPYFIMIAGGYLQHYILVKLYKATI